MSPSLSTSSKIPLAAYVSTICQHMACASHDLPDADRGRKKIVSPNKPILGGRSQVLLMLIPKE
jgi:hypothetical protein